MNGTTTTQYVIAFTVSCWVLATAMAQDTMPAQKAGWYIGANLLDRQGVVDDYGAINGTGYGVAMGYRLKGGHLSFELERQDFAFDDETQSAEGVTVRFHDAAADITMLSLLLHLNHVTWRPFARLTYGTLDYSYTLTNPEESQTFEDSLDGLVYGFGIDFVTSDKLDIRLEYGQQNEDIDGVNIGALYRF